MRKLSLIVALTIAAIINSYGSTWDEPWADKVIKEASSFVLAKIVACDSEKGITIKLIKTLGGKELKGTLIISDFYLLRMCSRSGHGAEFHTEEMDSCYLFISENKEGKYCIATPTTGFDYVGKGQVTSTFRHSYHQASVPVAIYEKTMSAIFNNYHDLPYDKIYITSFINEYLNKRPAGFSENEISIFFLQHVALECIHHLKLNINEGLIFPFLNAKNNFHSQVSAARALVAFNTDNSKRELLKIISDTSQRHFVQVMCVWTLSEFNPQELKPQLLILEKKAPDENDGFGGNIMDPRVCTSVPSVKEAIKSIISKI